MIKEIYDNYKGRAVYAYTLCGDGIKVKISDFGATILELIVGEGEKAKNICLGFQSTAEYVDSNSYVGATIGRVANRLHNGTFELGGTVYHTTINSGVNTNHGGTEGFNQKFYDVTEEADGSLTFSIISKDGEQGFPGELKFSVNYSLKGKELTMTYSAVSDKDTLWVPTNHSYFNLSGENDPDATITELTINADYYTPLNKVFVPTGEKRAVEGTPFDFRKVKPIGRDINADDEQLRLANGYDHNFILNGGEIAARAYSPKSGITMELSTDMPCMQLYTANGFNNLKGRTAMYNARCAFCLEPQFVPDAINLKGFDVPILKAGEEKTHYIKLKLFEE